MDALMNPVELWEIKSGTYKMITENTGNLPKLFTVAKNRKIPLNLVVSDRSKIAEELILKITKSEPAGNVYKFVNGEIVPYL